VSRRWCRIGAVAVTAWVCLAGAFLLIGWTWPKTATGWMVALGVGPLVYLGFEAVGIGLFYVGRRVLSVTVFAGLPRDRRRPPPAISLRNVAVGLIVALAWIGVAVVAVSVIGWLAGSDATGMLDEFRRRHFY